MTTLYIFLAGGMGAVLRWGVYKACNYYFPTFPAGVLICNLLGCFIIGVISGFIDKPTTFTIAITVGLLGGFTTFSSFSIDSIKLLQNQNWIGFSLYTSGSIFVGILLCWAGFSLSATIVKNFLS